MRNVTILFPVIVLLALGSPLAQAGGDSEAVVEKKIVVAVSADDFELMETDVSHLGIGDAETIVTDSGKTIDILRTEEGLEIYADGELINAGAASDMGLHEKHHIIHKRIEIECETEEECEELVWVSEDGDIDIDIESLHEAEHDIIMIHGDSAHEEMELLDGEHNRKVIIIKKEVDSI